jgi:hypothetical protein
MSDDIYLPAGHPVSVDQPVDPFPDSYMGVRGLPEDMIEAHSQLVESLRAQGDRRSAGAELADDTNIVGVGIGRSNRADAGEPGAPTLTVYLDEPREHADVETTLARTMNAPAVRSPRVPVVPVVTGKVHAISHTDRLRPAPGGSSLFNSVDAGSYGTMGCVATGRTAPRNQFAYVLSCNHVLARINDGQLNECVVQPSGGDHGTCASDQVAVLERYVTIKWNGAFNYVDCATATAWPDRVSRQLLQKTPAGSVTFPYSTSTVAPFVSQLVGKSGRSTEVTLGTVQELGVTHWVQYANGGQALFLGSIAIEGASQFAQEGDSGSLVWTWDLVRNPIGLLFSASRTRPRAFANQIDLVTQSLDIFLTP